MAFVVVAVTVSLWPFMPFLAFWSYTQVLQHPANVVSIIALDAFKRHILISLIHRGEAKTKSILTSTTDHLVQEYSRLANSYVASRRKKIECSFCMGEPSIFSQHFPWGHPPTQPPRPLLRYMNLATCVKNFDVTGVDHILEQSRKEFEEVRSPSCVPQS